MMIWPLHAPELKSERLCLRAFADEHLTETYVSWLNDPDVVRYSEQRHRKHSLESCHTYWTGMRASGGLLWAIEEKEAGHIGNLSVHADLNNQSAELAIMIGARTSWGKGYGSEAWGAVMEYLLSHVGVRRVWAGTMAINQGMLAIFEKTGMCCEGICKRVFLCEGQEVDLVWASSFAETTVYSTRFLRAVGT